MDTTIISVNAAALKEELCSHIDTAKQNYPLYNKVMQNIDIVVDYRNLMKSYRKADKYLAHHGDLIFANKSKFQCLMESLLNHFQINVSWDGGVCHTISAEAMMNFEATFTNNELKIVDMVTSSKYMLQSLEDTSTSLCLEGSPQNTSQTLCNPENDCIFPDSLPENLLNVYDDSLGTQDKTWEPIPDTSSSRKKKHREPAITNARGLGAHQKKIENIMTEYKVSEEGSKGKSVTFASPISIEEDCLSEENLMKEWEKAADGDVSEGESSEESEVEFSKKKKKLRIKLKKTTNKQSKKNKSFSHQETVEKDGFWIEGSDPNTFLEHLDQYTAESIRSTQQIIGENIPIIHNSFVTIKNFVDLLEKLLKKIPYQQDPNTGEIHLKCSGCQIHCVPNWDIHGLPGRPTRDSLKKMKAPHV